MRIDGRWVTGADGVERPVFDAALLHPGGQHYPIQLVLDTGVDCTLRMYEVGQALAAAALPQPGPLASSAGGAAPTILLDVTLAFTTIDGRRVGLRGPIPALLDFSVLGRNAIDLLALAYDRLRGLLALVGPPDRWPSSREARQGLAHVLPPLPAFRGSSFKMAFERGRAEGVEGRAEPRSVASGIGIGCCDR